MGNCMDCGRKYGDDTWLDVTMTDEQWAGITGITDHSQVLCGYCMLDRVGNYPGISHAWLIMDQDEFESSENEEMSSHET